MREVQRLRELPKIIILDLSGNPCTTSSPEDYRLYVIYNVRKLKVRGACSRGHWGPGVTGKLLGRHTHVHTRLASSSLRPGWVWVFLSCE